MTHIVCDRPAYFDPAVHGVFVLDLNTDLNLGNLVFKVGDARMKKTAEEKLERKKKYRREYSKREEVRAASRAKNREPKIKAIRKDYNSQPYVKERKKKLAKRGRAIPAILKQKLPELYERLVQEADQLIQEHVKPIFQCGSTEYVIQEDEILPESISDQGEPGGAY